jgi:hypothetical protein
MAVKSQCTKPCKGMTRRAEQHLDVADQGSGESRVHAMSTVSRSEKEEPSITHLPFNFSGGYHRDHPFAVL